MLQYLKQSTAIVVMIGPFVDTDGYTLEDGLLIEQDDIRLSKNGGDFSQKNDGNNSAAEGGGYYGLYLDATDTNTLGRLTVACTMSGVRPVYQEFMVVSANVWDSLFGAARLDVDVASASSAIVTEIGNAVMSESLLGHTSINTMGYAIQAVYDNIYPASITMAHLESMLELNTGLYRFTENALEEAPGGGTPLTAQETRDAMKLAPSAGDPAAGSVDAHLDTIEADTDEMQGDLADGGRIDSILDAILADTGTDGVAISVAVRQAIADEILKRGIANVEDSAEAISLAGQVLAAFESAISGSTWTIYKTNHATVFATRQVTSSPTADPIVEVT